MAGWKLSAVIGAGKIQALQFSLLQKKKPARRAFFIRYALD